MSCIKTVHNWNLKFELGMKTSLMILGKTPCAVGGKCSSMHLVNEPTRITNENMLVAYLFHKVKLWYTSVFLKETYNTISLDGLHRIY